MILPNLAAGCSMADMAQTDDVLDCWDELRETLGPDHGIIPVTYMNSAAALKAFCGKNGGVVCTSSNAGAVLAWALERGKRILFFPDQHLGRNTALAMGYALEDTAVWAPGKPLGGNTAEALAAAPPSSSGRGTARCTVASARSRCSPPGSSYPEVRVVVHPECTREVVALADCNGSTEYIIKVVAELPAGSVWAVGTEINLVNRLQKEHPDKTIFCLDPVICPCSTMYRIHPAYLAWALDNLVAGRVVNRVQVDRGGGALGAGRAGPDAADQREPGVVARAGRRAARGARTRERSARLRRPRRQRAAPEAASRLTSPLRAGRQGAAYSQPRRLAGAGPAGRPGGCRSARLPQARSVPAGIRGRAEQAPAADARGPGVRPRWVAAPWPCAATALPADGSRAPRAARTPHSDGRAPQRHSAALPAHRACSSGGDLRPAPRTSVGAGWPVEEASRRLAASGSGRARYARELGGLLFDRARSVRISR